jgi:ribosomal protein L18E
MSERGNIQYWNPDMTLDMVRHALGDTCILKITVAGEESVHDLTGVIALRVHEQIMAKIKENGVEL